MTYGIIISGYNSYGVLEIKSNFMYNTLRKSIWIINIDSYFTTSNVLPDYAFGVEIYQNYIKYNTYVGSSNITGISLSNCQGWSGPKIHNNNLTHYARPSSTNAHKYKGIDVKDVINGSIYNNKYSSLGRGY